MASRRRIGRYEIRRAESGIVVSLADEPAKAIPLLRFPTSTDALAFTSGLTDAARELLDIEVERLRERKG